MSDNDWEQIEEWAKKLNSSPEFQMFQVGLSGILVGGDWMLCKSEGSSWEAQISDVKPGIWTIKQDEPEFLLRWVSSEIIDFDNLPTSLPEPHLSPLSPWRNIDSYSVDSGAHGLLDKDGLDKLSAIEDHEVAVEMLMDMGLALPIGISISGDDGGYTIKGRKHNGKLVEIMVTPFTGEDEDDEEDEGEDEDGGED